MLIYNKQLLFDNKIYIDIPSHFDYVEINDTTETSRYPKSEVWVGPNNTILSVQAAEENSQPIDDNMNFFRTIVREKYGEIKNIQYSKRERNGFMQVLAEDEVTSGDQKFHFMISILIGNHHTITIYQRSNWDNRDKFRLFFLPILDSIHINQEA